MLKETLTKLRKQKDLSQYEITRLLGIPRSTYAMYEAGYREPNYAILKKLADFFNVSVDYLLGRIDDPKGRVVELDPDIRTIARASQKMSSDQKSKMVIMLKIAFEEAFKDEQ